MTRYRLDDDEGRTLYAGEVISGRRYTPARRVGWLPGITLGAGVTSLALLLGVLLPVALMIGGLAGQVLVNVMQRRYSRKIWKFTRDRAAGEAQKPKELAAQEKRRHVQIAADAELPYVDYESGEIWPPDKARAWLAEEYRKDSIGKEIKRRREEYDALTATKHWDHNLEWAFREKDRLRAEIRRLEAELAGDSPAELDRLDQAEQALDDMEKHLDRADAVDHRMGLAGKRVQFVNGRPGRADAARRARLADGRIVELTNHDLDVIRTPGFRFNDESIIGMPSGFNLTGVEMTLLARDLRAIEQVDFCPHGMPRHLSCVQCRIDLSTEQGEIKAAKLLDQAQIISWAAGPWADFPARQAITMPSGAMLTGQTVNRRIRQARRDGPDNGRGGRHRHPDVIRADIDQLVRDSVGGKISSEVAYSLDIDLHQELKAALDATAEEEGS